jgi:hypothetical protein
MVSQTVVGGSLPVGGLDHKYKNKINIKEISILKGNKT